MIFTSKLPALGAIVAVAAFVGLAQLAAPPASADTAEPDAQAQFLKDLDIRQAPMTEILPPVVSKPSTASAQSAQYAVMAAVDRPDARYRDGDSLELTIQVTEDSYVWVFDTGTSGQVAQVFPNRFESDNFARAGTALTIPRQGKDYRFVVSRPAGADLLTVIASKDNAPLSQALIDQQTQAGPFLALQGNASSVAKDLSITLKESHPNWVGHQMKFYIE